MESLEDEDDDDDLVELGHSVFGVSQGHVTHQQKGILPLVTSTPHATGESSGCRPSQTVDGNSLNNIEQNIEKAEEEPFFKSRLCRLMAVVLLVISIGVGVTIPLATKSSSGPTPTPAQSVAPTLAPMSGERLTPWVCQLLGSDIREGTIGRSKQGTIQGCPMASKH